MVCTLFKGSARIGNGKSYVIQDLIIVVMVAVTVVIPHKEGDPLNLPVIGPEDELLVIEGLGAGEARIRGATDARNEWIITCDADGVYPNDYVEKAKEIIESGKYPYGFKALRLGGFAPSVGQEAGMVVPRELFLQRTRGFVPNGRWDVGHLLRDIPVEPSLTYYHDLTFGESTLTAIAVPAAVGVALVWFLGRRKGR